MRLFIDPVKGVISPVQYFSVVEPKTNLSLGILDTVTAMAYVAANLNLMSKGRSVRMCTRKPGNKAPPFQQLSNFQTYLDTEIASDGSGSRLQGVGSTQHFSASRDSFLSFPHHAYHRSRKHVVSKLWEEWLFDKIFVVFFQQFLCRLLGLHGTQFVSLCFKATDNVSHNTAL